MNITCIITTSSITEIGGLQWSIRRISELLISSGWLVDIVFIDQHGLPGYGNHDIPGVSLSDGWRSEIKIWTIQRLNLQGFRSRVSSEEFDTQHFISGLERICRSRNYQLLHAFSTTTAGYIATLVARHLQIPVLVSARGSDINLAALSPSKLAQIRWVLENANALTFVSKDLLAKANLLNPCLERSKVIMNSTHDTYFGENSAAIHYASQNNFYVCGAGLLNMKKNPYELLLVCARLLQRDIPVHLIWIGTISELDKPVIDKWIAQLDLSDAITITGRINHEMVLSIMKQTNIFLSASTNEGCPNAILEAMLAAKPVVAYAVGAIPEIVRHEKDGLVSSPSGTQILVDFVERLSKNPTQVREYGLSARKRILNDFTPEKEQKDWIECYKNVVRMQST